MIALNQDTVRYGDRAALRRRFWIGGALSVAVCLGGLSCGRSATRPGDSDPPPPPETQATWRYPGEFPSLQATLDRAADGDTVLLAPGTYSGDDVAHLTVAGSGLVVIGSGGADSCIIRDGWFQVGGIGSAPCVFRGLAFVDCRGAAISCTNARIEITGCRFEGGVAADGPGLWLLDTEAWIRECVFRNNVAREGEGGAIFSEYSRLAFDRCEFSGNSAKRGGAISATGSQLRIEDCRLASNFAEQTGGAMVGYVASVSCVRSVIADNVAGDSGGGISLRRGAIVCDRCTVAGNSAGVGGGVLLTDLSSALVSGSILWGNCDADVSVSEGGTLALSDCAIDTTRITGARAGDLGRMAYGDPGFCRYAGCGGDGDYALRADSPCRLPDGSVLGAIRDACR